MSRKKVMVNILNMGTTTAGWETRLFAWMQEKAKDYEFNVFFPTRRPINANRNKIAQDFLKGDWDYLVMLDDDNPCYENIFNLLDLNLPVVGGVYPGRDDYGITFHVYEATDLHNGRYSFKIYPPEKREGLQKVDAIGTGLIVIQRWVMEKIAKEGMIPFQDFPAIDGAEPGTDDVAFCMRCKKLGIDVWADYDYVGSHFKEVDLLWIANLVAYAAKTGKTNFPHGDPVEVYEKTK
jgi:hypothetical protein